MEKEKQIKRNARNQEIQHNKISEFEISFYRLWNTGLVSRGASLATRGESASLALVGHTSSDSVTIKIPYGVDV